ncbi:NAD(P)/FAD-dependent oxidoreductase [Luteithermobacter gelatinilyticus]|uniref:NAD(P)/FAD-dependent oxidoreductase n=1 Tax=Luteithermobacter gelatinilyticus TaxID=2582913 RepID=UPI0011060028|nr:NAD(P)/FAD-dependent oxidoreductase [Luteithermobacter gelatinilyticus]
MGEETYQTDMIIIGAGPVGLFAVFEAGLLGMKCHLIDNLDRPGGQCTELYPEKPIYDIPSRPKVTGQELVDNLIEQCRPFEPRFHLSQQAGALRQLSSGHWRIETTRDVAIEAPVVVVAAGAGSFVPKKPPYPDLELFEEKSVRYAVKNMDNYRDKKLVIVGGGDSALDWVMNLYPLARRITLVHRREAFRGAPDSAARVLRMAEEGKIDHHVGEITGLFGKNGQLEAVHIHKKNGEEVLEECDILMPFLGLKISLGAIAEWGLNLTRNHVDVDPATFATSTPGIYAIGDVCNYPGKLKLILTGFYEAAVMARAAFKYAYPDRKIAGGYTTTSSVLQDRLGVK